MDAYAEPPNTAPLEHVIDAMLPANRHLHNHTTDAQPLPKYHVVTYRNNLNKIMGTPYNTNSAYTMQMQRIQGCVYLNVTLSHIPPSSFSSNQAQGAYAGRRYEVLSSAAVGGGEYCGVFSVSLGQKKLLIGAEMDGVTASKDDDDDTTNYVELKTFRILNTPKDRFTFERYKLLAFWIQSYLVGVPTIRVGFRNESFILTKEQAFETADLPRYGDKHWHPSVCVAFTDLVLSWFVEQPLQEMAVYTVEYKPQTKCMTMSLSTTPPFVKTPLSNY
ncbi:hypothetical protein, variant 3 [Aphanomyces astaci]|nr:hypothetical protein, variant 2 [Aphanomyces astaci]XP_009838524.1 hypothetical protein, variant 3 [Aphanomyces astaci]ETV72078.1 hypothetical protein, variant 2 [Aphanomyces astaci]ETV72079.1 hypothetical protein, variant 3 [Aphanomyces astaci]|eukprot:XP_009838523.1 hypothetical protein, variant 2 [Aphanomyces astaci]